MKPIPPPLGGEILPPFHQLGSGGKRFEALCADLISARRRVEVELHGRSGEKDFGFDLEFHDPERGLTVGQCKAVGSFTAGQLREVSEEFLKHEPQWRDRQIRAFSLLVGCDLSSTEVRAEIDRQRQRFKDLGLDYEVDSARSLREKLWPFPYLVNRYFRSDEWIRLICGPDETLPPATQRFRGFRPFEEKHSRLFSRLRRTTETKRILGHLEDPRVRLVTVIGEPGVGKTSLILAGVLPGLGSGLRPRKLEAGVRQQLDSIGPSLDHDIKEGRRPLLVCDQLEHWYELEPRAWKRVLDLIRETLATRNVKVLIGIRQEYLRQLEEADLVTDKNLGEKVWVDRLAPEQALDTIRWLTAGLFGDAAIRKLVSLLGETSDPGPGRGEPSPADREAMRPRTAYIQIVVGQLWEELKPPDRDTEVRPEEIDRDRVADIIEQYLVNVLDGLPRPQAEAASEILRLLVRQSRTDVIVANPLSIEELASQSGQDRDSTSELVASLKTRGIVLQRGQGEPVRIINDFLARIIYSKYDSVASQVRDALDRLVRSFGVYLDSSIDPEIQEKLLLDAMGKLLQEVSLDFQQKLTSQQQERLLCRLLAESGGFRTLVAGLQGQDRHEAARLAAEPISQLLLLFGDEDRSRQVRSWIEPKPGPATADEGSEDDQDDELLRSLLRLAQQRREYSLPEMRQALGLPSRLQLWRVLKKLRDAGQIRAPSDPDADPTGASLFAERWTLAPTRKYLISKEAVEDQRTYRGVLVHIPAGEHAMRNQRVARELLIRTVAVEQRWRRSAPGFHEADDPELVLSYSPEELRRTIESTARDYAVMLNSREKRMWVLQEAVEFPTEELVKICDEVTDELLKENAMKGRVVTDAGACVANRKDLIRALATVAGVPQPRHRVVAAGSEASWSKLWRKGLEEPGAIEPLPGDYDDQPPEEQRRCWIEAVGRAVHAVGGRAVIKPAVTEFLKAATWVTESRSDLELAWDRLARAPIASPQVIVEEEIRDIDRELLVTVVRRSRFKRDGYVETAPVWYCVDRKFDWRSDSEHRSVPMTMDYAWVSPAEDLDDGVFARAQELTRSLAESLWKQIKSRRYLAENRFLQAEWLVRSNGELLLNEIKPTQLNKGIISRWALSHSDSELLVRGLFGLPLPKRVTHIRPQEAVVCGFVSATSPKDIAMIKKRRLLIAYDGVGDALRLADKVQLYPDKMRSRPYIGRPMGVITTTGASLEDARQAFLDARACLTPRYEGEKAKA